MVLSARIKKALVPRQANEKGYEMLNKLEEIVYSKRFDRFILAVIVINAITLGLETAPVLLHKYHFLTQAIDKICLAIFVIEILAKLLVRKIRFFQDPWSVFDFIIVGIAFLPTNNAFHALRTLRVLRTLRLISVSSQLRKVVTGLLAAIPGLGAVSTILLLLFYIGSVIATKMFRHEFPEWFGSVGSSAYSLFQIMTLESWSMGIVRPVMEQFPWAWAFFVPFILITSFTMLNLFIAVIVNSMQIESEQSAADRAEQGHSEREALLLELRDLKNQVKELGVKIDRSVP